jgi:phenylpyruvate tautomerase PptA (4-oxalocrotonate tautomerase family)
MPMIDVYAPSGLFPDVHALARELAATLKSVEQVPELELFRANTAAFVHEVPAAAISDVNGSSDHVRVTVLTNQGALDRDKQLAAVRELSRVVAEHAGDASLVARTWVQLTEAYDGGWGIGGEALTNDGIVAAARAELAG